MIKYLVISMGVLLIALGVSGWMLKKSYEENGALRTSVDALTKANAAKTAATRSRATTDSAVRKMAPAEKLEKLK